MSYSSLNQQKPYLGKGADDYLLTFTHGKLAYSPVSVKYLSVYSVNSFSSLTLL